MFGREPRVELMGSFDRQQLCTQLPRPFAARALTRVLLLSEAQLALATGEHTEAKREFCVLYSLLRRLEQEIHRCALCSLGYVASRLMSCAYPQLADAAREPGRFARGTWARSEYSHCQHSPRSSFVQFSHLVGLEHQGPCPVLQSRPTIFVC